MDPSQQSEDPKNCKNPFKKCKNSKKRRMRKRKCMNKKQIKEQFEQTRIAIGSFVGTFSQAPSYLVENEFIQNGYRINYEKSSWQIFRSLFQFHNESVNVWSHLLGMLLFIYLMTWVSFSVLSYQEMGEVVWKGLPKINNEKVHIAKFF